MRHTAAGALVLALCLVAARAPRAQTSSGEAARRQAYDALLDVYVRDGLVYYRALKADRAKLDGYVASLAAVARRQAAARRAGGVLAERLQRARPADRARSLSRSRRGEDISAAQHPPDSRRLRTPDAPGRRPDRDARSDRADDPAGLPRSARLPRPRPRVGRRRAPAQRSVRAGPARGAADRGRQRVRQPAAVLAGGRRDEHRFVSSIFSWREKEFIAAYAGAAAPAFASEARSNGPCWRSSTRSCSPPSGSTSARTSSRSPSSRTTGA